MARAYSMILPRFWQAGSGKRLRGDIDAQFLALYLMTSPSSNMIGLFHVSPLALADDTGLPAKRITAALAKLAAEGVAYYDDAEGLAYLPSMARVQTGSTLKPTDAKVKGTVKMLAVHKGHPFAVHFFNEHRVSHCLPDCANPSLVKSATYPETEGACRGPTGGLQGVPRGPTGGLVPVPDLNQGQTPVATLPSVEGSSASPLEASSSVLSGSDPDQTAKVMPVVSLPSTPVKTPNAIGSHPSDFDRFWLAYPRKVSKGAAERAWAARKPPVQDVIDALMWQRSKLDWTKEGGKFIPHPATWLNAKGWEDERPEEHATRRTVDIQPGLVSADPVVMAEVLTDFDLFWDAYPKKVARGPARGAWERSRPPIDKCLATLKWQINCPEWRRDGGQWVPTPATWIDQQRWDDEKPEIISIGRELGYVGKAAAGIDGLAAWAQKQRAKRNEQT